VLAVLDAVHVPVVADANGGLHEERDRVLIDALCGLPLAWLEQPFAAGDLASHAILAQRGSVPIGLDESVRSARAVRDIARYGAATVVCLKPARLGGVARTRDVMAAAIEAGLRPYVGGYFEAGLGRAVLGALSSLPPGGLDGDVAAPCTYLEHDPCALEGPFRGRQPLWSSPGCGPAPVATALRLVEERTYAT
jgi:O-succinylbenzoate synthase